jgi:bifunctional UDP-N-acetylglucosamine pyrophosphorylase / glucosamine-1-phosphate N-acetyltransferase
MTHSQQIQAIILAAGRSSRFKTDTTKLSFTLCGREMILYPLVLLHNYSIPTSLVIGYQKEKIRALVENAGYPVTFVEQSTQRGTGDAVLCTRAQWYAEHILILNGDAPLIRPETITLLIEKHSATHAALTFVTASDTDPSLKGYGRVIHDANHLYIKEAAECGSDEYLSCPINAGIYLVQRRKLEYALPLVQPSDSGEFYFTDLIRILSSLGERIETIYAPFDTVRGINTLKELSVAEHIKRSELISNLMEQGVHFSMPHTVHIDVDVIIEPDTIIGAGAVLTNGTIIRSHSIIGDYSCISKSTIAEEVVIRPYSTIYDSVVEAGAHIGPAAHIRNHTVIGTKSVIGNFVEVNNSFFGSQSKAKHLSYIGTSSVGNNVNIGAGAITCNYDGHTKHKTTIEDNVFVGSNSSFIAPISIGKDSIIGAGSVITDNVPPQALAIARARQVTKHEYHKNLPKKSTTLYLEP